MCPSRPMSLDVTEAEFGEEFDPDLIRAVQGATLSRLGDSHERTRASELVSGPGARLGAGVRRGAGSPPEGNHQDAGVRGTPWVIAIRSGLELVCARGQAAHCDGTLIRPAV